MERLLRVAPVVAVLLVVQYLSQILADEFRNVAMKYDTASFNDRVPKSPHFIMFYAPWCGHCKRLAPTWEDLAEMQLTNIRSKDVVIAKVDCTEETELCTRQDVTGYPTLKYFYSSIEKGLKYKGSRDLESLKLYIAEQSVTSGDHSSKYIVEPEVEVAGVPEPDGTGLYELTDSNFHSHVARGQHFIKFYAPWCGHCQRLAPTWQELAKSLQYDKSVSISKVDCTVHRGICNEFDVKGYPSLLWVEDGKKIEKYQGDRTHEDLKQFITKMKRRPNEILDDADDEGEGDDDSDEQEAADVGDKSEVAASLTFDNFANAVENKLAFVKFYAPWCKHCQNLAPIWEQLAVKLLATDNVVIAKVDCTLEGNKALCHSNGVEGYPTMILFKNGEKLEEYSGQRELGSLHDFVVRNLDQDTREEL